MKTKRRALSLFAAIALVSTPRSATSQVTTLSDLTFGTVITGTTTAIGATSASAASWRIRGSIGVAGVITLSLPSTLTRSGGGSMPVSFCTTCARYRINNSNPAGATSFDPNSLLILTIVLLSDLYIWLGGSVSPPLAQTPGSYSGTVVITVTPLL